MRMVHTTGFIFEYLACLPLTILQVHRDAQYFTKDYLDIH